MPQNNVFLPFVKGGVQVPVTLDSSGNMPVVINGTSSPVPTGAKSSLNITAATAVKATPGTALVVTVVVAGSGAGTVNDCATTGAAAAANVIASLPTAVGTYILNFPCLVGIVVAPGTGQTIAISYL